MKNFLLILFSFICVAAGAQQTEMITPSGAFTLSYHGHIDGYYTGYIKNNLNCTEKIWISWNDGEGDSSINVHGKSGLLIKIKAKQKGNSIIRVGTPSRCGKKDYEVTCFVVPVALPLREPELAGPSPKPVPEKELTILNTAGAIIKRIKTADSYFKVISKMPAGSYIILEGRKATKLCKI